MNSVTSRITKIQCQNTSKYVGYCGRLLCCLAFDPPVPGEDICGDDKAGDAGFYRGDGGKEEGSENPEPLSAAVSCLPGGACLPGEGCLPEGGLPAGDGEEISAPHEIREKTPDTAQAAGHVYREEGGNGK